MLTLTLFGPGNLSHDEQYLAGFPHQQAHRLFCYLLLRRQQPHYREKLAGLFWGDYATAVSRKYLRQAMWQLRQTLLPFNLSLDDYLTIDREVIIFQAVQPYWLDIERFETALKPHQQTDGSELTLPQVQGLEEAINLYKGDLLEGVYDDWCLSERERLRMLYLNTLRKLMAFHEKNGSYKQAIVHGERVLAQDDTREAIHQQMMRLYWYLDNRDAAIEQYKRCAQNLRQTMNMTPMAETTQLYQQILNQTHPAEVAPVSTHTTTYLLNRIGHLEQRLSQTQTELQQLRTMLNDLSHTPDNPS